MNFKNLVVFFIFIVSVTAFAGTCPAPSSATAPHVFAKVKFNKKSKLYTYSYTVQNGRNAKIPIDEFDLVVSKKPKIKNTPEKWIHHYFDSGEQSNLSWVTVWVKNGDKISEPGSPLPIPEYAIRPNKSVSGFSIESLNPPGPIQYLVDGTTAIPVVDPTPDDDEPEVECPGWTVHNPRFKSLPTGMTIGPMDPGIVPVKIRLREKEGRYAGGPWSPKKPYGQVSVLVVSTHSFDASKIDVSSISFGPGEAVPIAHKLVRGDFGKPYDLRERTDWEEFVEGKSVHRSKFKNLLLVFDLKSLDVQCGLDQAVFLHGKTTTGKKIFGAAKTNLIGCHPGHPGWHHPDIRHRNWEKRHPGHKYKEHPHPWDGE